jgi:cell division transport system permease protein
MAAPQKHNKIVARPSLKKRLKAWHKHHIKDFFFSLDKLLSSPLSTLMTVSVIGIALALPMTLYLVLINAQVISNAWDGDARISIFMTNNSDLEALEGLAAQLNKDTRIKHIKTVTPDQAMEEFKKLSGFGDALNALDKNPLPYVIIVTPIDTLETAKINLLAKGLQKIDNVDLAQIDLHWVKRLFAMLELIERAILIMASLLASAVLLVIGNTIRLDIQNRKEEIIIIKLIGGTNAFIRRPFLYGGILLGILGGLFAWVCISTAIYLLSDPGEALAVLYNSEISIKGLNFNQLLTLLSGSVFLGWFGSLLSVSKHLNEIEPS